MRLEAYRDGEVERGASESLTGKAHGVDEVSFFYLSFWCRTALAQRG